MHLNLNPIEKHKSEIERRISQLQEKFREREAPKPSAKKNRDHLHDQNKAYQPSHAISKTVEVRGKIRAQGQGKTNRQSCYRPAQTKQPLSETGVIRNIKDNRQPRADGKEQKIKELYDMMRLILQGQKNIEKEINQLKQENTKDFTNRSQIHGQTSFIQHRSPLQSSLDKLSLSKEKANDRSNKKIPASNNQSILIKEQIEPKQHKNKHKKNKLKKDHDFEGSLQQLKEQCRDGHRYCVGEQWKARIWAEVEGRVRQSEKEYKDTIHRNNKHEYDHLINTFELQRKLKDDLIDKVYQQCNPQIYK